MIIYCSVRQDIEHSRHLRMLIKNWIAVRKQNFSKPGPNEDTLESDMLIDEMFIINEMVGID